MTQHSRRSSARSFALALAAILLPATLVAQERSSTEAQPAASAASAPGVSGTAVAPPASTNAGSASAAPVVTGGPRLAPSGIQRVATPLPVLGDGQDDPHLGVGQNLALMGAGGAAVIVGLLIGGDSGTIIAVSGGVIALVGLYRYLR